MTRSITTLVFAMLISLGALGAKGYEIKVQIEGISDTPCYLGYYYGDKQYLIDTVQADKAGKFTFSGDEPLEGGIYLIVMPDKTYFEILMTEEQHFSVTASKPDYVKTIKLKGTENNALFYDYLHYMSNKFEESQELRAIIRSIKGDEDSIVTYRDKLRAVEEDTKKYKLEFIEKYPNHLLSAVFKASRTPDIPEPPLLPNGKKDSTFSYRYYKSHFFDHTDFSDDRLIRTPVFHEKINTYMERLTAKIPDSVIIACDYLLSKAPKEGEVFKYMLITFLNKYAASKIMCMDAVYAHLVDTYYAKGYATWIDTVALYRMKERAKVMNFTKCGKKAWNFVLKDMKGQYISLEQVEADLTMLVFWDPDCGHCKKAMPKIKIHMDKFEGENVKVVAVDTEDDLKKWKEFVKDKELDGWIHLEDSARASGFRYVYDLTSTPKIYILDKDKKIIGKGLAHDQIEGFIRDRLKEIKERKARDKDAPQKP